jgi:hypothetical protein
MRMLPRSDNALSPPRTSFFFPLSPGSGAYATAGFSLCDFCLGEDKEDLDLVPDLSGYSIVHFAQYQFGFMPELSINLESLRLQYGQYRSLRSSICV